MKIFRILPILAFCLTSCEKNGENPLIPLSINIQYHVDGQEVIMDSLMYINDAGYTYSITKLEYYISEITFVNTAGNVLKLDGIYYINIDENPTNVLQFSDITPGNYTSVNFNIGIDSANNQTGFLPNTIENNNMAWPDPMGGGYHFVKLEGRYKTGGELFGYTMHIGRNKNLVKVNLENEFDIRNASNDITLRMNINEWFRNPNIIDFETDGNYSMSDDLFMHRLSQNGTNTFTVKK